MIFVCPKCRGKLNITEGGAAKCAEGHSYDRSRFGYYNLLLSERGGTHGDNKDMVEARRKFLSDGYYQPLASRFASIAAELALPGGVILDAGSGEGYYTLAVREACQKAGVRVAAFDISKDAVRLAAKRGAADEYAVAGSYHMPLADASVDLVMNTFSPLAKEEVERVLKPGGIFMMAIPAEEHLFSLKAKIYEVPYKNKPGDTTLDGFTLIGREEIKYDMKLDTSDGVRSLFMMTPYAYRTNAEGRARVLSMDSLVCEAHFLVLTYRKDLA
ncbi:MAG: methyltransferase domain-containing protein [Clostridia bacterium]|nr:methyltransferase domain-containing protein [Clostridia bacterium]